MTRPTGGAARPDGTHVHAWFAAPPPAGVVGGDDARELRRRLLRSSVTCPHVGRLYTSLVADGHDVEQPVPPSAVGGTVEVRQGRARARVGITWVWSPGSDDRSWLAWTSPVHRRGRRGVVAADLAASLRPRLHAALVTDPDVAEVRWLTDDEARATET